MQPLSLPPFALEVPITAKVDPSRLPTVDVGPPTPPIKFNFPASTVIGTSLSCVSPVATSATHSASHGLIWELDTNNPTILLLRRFSIDSATSTSTKQDAVRLQFSSPILPSIAYSVTSEAITVYIVTADGSLRAISYPTSSSTTKTPPPCLADHLSPGSDAITALPLDPTFDRLGAPTSLLYIDGHVCIGTTQGHIVSLPLSVTPSSTPTPTTPLPASVDDAFELNGGAGFLGSLIGGLLSRVNASAPSTTATATTATATPHAVEQLAEIDSLDRSLLCSIHAGAVLKLWDLQFKKLIHSCDLLPAQDSKRHTASLVRVAIEPLDATCSILLIFFNPVVMSGAALPPTHARGMLCTFEIFVEDRGGSSTKVLLEGGPRLESSEVCIMVDLAVQHLGDHSIGAWMLYDDDQGKRKLDCVPLQFTDGAVNSSVKVELLEEQIDSLRGSDLNVLSSLGSALSSSVSSKENRFDIFLDSIFGPGKLYRSALVAATATVSMEWAHHLRDTIALEHDLSSLRSSLSDAIHAQPDPLSSLSDLLSSYAHAISSHHPPLALVHLLGHGDDSTVMVVRSGGGTSIIRQAQAPELLARSAWPPAWDALVRVSDVTGIKSLLQAMTAVVRVLGGRPGLSLILGRIQQGDDFTSHISPLLLRWFVAGEGSEEWRAACRLLPLTLGRLCAVPVHGYARAIDALTSLLSQSLANSSMQSHSRMNRSPLGTVTSTLTAAALTQSHQLSSSLCDCLIRISTLNALVTSQHTLGVVWSLPEVERKAIEGRSGEAVAQWLASAVVAHWSSSSPVAQRELDIDSLDPSALVVSLRIGGGSDSSGGGGEHDGDGAREHSRGGPIPLSKTTKRARLTPDPDTIASSIYPATYFLPLFQQQAHAVRDVLDLASVSMSFSLWLTNTAQVTDLDVERRVVAGDLNGTNRALDLSPALLRHHMSDALRQLLSLPGAFRPEDPRYWFLHGCSKALALQEEIERKEGAKKASTSADQEKEKEAMALFFRVAGMFPHHVYFQRQLEDIFEWLSILRHSHSPPSSSSASTAAAAIHHPNVVSQAHNNVALLHLSYYEMLMKIFERLDCSYAASKFALTATQYIDDAFGEDNAVEQRVQRTGTLWAAVFSYCLQAGEYEEAYAALLGNQVAEIQIDCVHELVNDMVDRGAIEMLCSLPFALNALVVRQGRPQWVSLLDEAVTALRNRAENSDIGAGHPQPYHVLFDFQVARGNYQAAAAAMLTYARRLVAEAPADNLAAQNALQALALAVSALGLVDPEFAWLEDPSYSSTPSPVDAVSGGSPQQQQQHARELIKSGPLVTLSDLKKEYALVCAKAAVAAVLPQGDVGASGPREVFYQLLAVGLYDEAFSLADAAFEGTLQQRMRERAVYDVAKHCAEVQLQIGGSGSGGRRRAWGAGAAGPGSNRFEGGEDGMQMDDGEGEGEEGDDVDMTTTTAAAPVQSINKKKTRGSSGVARTAAVSWQLLRRHLERYESKATCGYSLRVIAVDAILSTDTEIRPPLWLLTPFSTSAPTSTSTSMTTSA